MDGDHWVAITAILGIVTLDSIALVTQHDGALFGISVTAIASVIEFCRYLRSKRKR
jgi:hypothetical protein